MTGLFHHAFERALDGDLDGFWPWLDNDERNLGALAVYRNTAAKGRIDALRDNYPTVRQLVGDDWFEAAAQVYAHEQPGGDPAMAGYGDGFAAWLARFQPAVEMPYLAPVARLDRAWTEAHLAADILLLDAAETAAIGGIALAGRILTPTPSTRLFWFDWSAPSLWLAHRYPDETVGDLEWIPRPEGLLVHRPHHVVKAYALHRTEWLFLDACRSGRTLGAAAATVQIADPAADIAALFARLIGLGVFQTLRQR